MIDNQLWGFFMHNKVAINGGGKKYGKNETLKSLYMFDIHLFDISYKCSFQDVYAFIAYHFHFKRYENSFPKRGGKTSKTLSRTRSNGVMGVSQNFLTILYDIISFFPPNFGS